MSPRYRPEPIDRAAHVRRSVQLFNAGEYWAAHEELETVWRSIPDERTASVYQGLIQAAAALLHRQRGNPHGNRVVGQRALDKLAGSQHPAVEFETEEFRRILERALREGGDPPQLRTRTEDERY